MPYCFSCSIAARILGTTSGQKRYATASKRVAVAKVHLTVMGSGLKTSLPKRLPASSAADSAEPIVTPAFRPSPFRALLQRVVQPYRKRCGSRRTRRSGR